MVQVLTLKAEWCLGICSWAYWVWVWLCRNCFTLGGLGDLISKVIDLALNLGRWVSEGWNCWELRISMISMGVDVLLSLYWYSTWIRVWISVCEEREGEEVSSTTPTFFFTELINDAQRMPTILLAVQCHMADIYYFSRKGAPSPSLSPIYSSFRVSLWGGGRFHIGS